MESPYADTVIVEPVPFSPEITAIISAVWPEAASALISSRAGTGATVLMGSICKNEERCCIIETSTVTEESRRIRTQIIFYLPLADFFLTLYSLITPA